MKQITINDLWKACVEERKKGNGKKKILVSSDEEGNSFNPLYYLFTPTKDPNEEQDFFDAAYIDKPCGVTDENINDYIILG